MDIIKHSNPNIFREANPYGKWLHNTFNWTHFATLRPYWKIYEHTGEKFMNNLKKYKAIQSVFYVIEPDEVNWKNYHIHMLIHVVTCTHTYTHTYKYTYIYIHIHT